MYRPKPKPIPNFPGYSITRHGSVWSEKSHKWLVTYIDKVTGYVVVGLIQNGHQRPRYIHRLLLETFVGPCPLGMECRHLDGNKLNDGLNNLCWGTRGENYADSVVHNRHVQGERNGSSKLTNSQAVEIRHLLSTGVTGRELAKRFHVSDVCISNIKHNKHYREVG